MTRIINALSWPCRIWLFASAAWLGWTVHDVLTLQPLPWLAFDVLGFAAFAALYVEQRAEERDRSQAAQDVT